jgi:hypothetical protein
MAQIRVERTIAADPTSTALLLAGLGAAPPQRTATAFVTSVPIGPAGAVVTLSYGAAIDGRVTTTAVLVAEGDESLRLAAAGFLRDLARAAEQRSSAA